MTDRAVVVMDRSQFLSRPVSVPVRLPGSTLIGPIDREKPWSRVDFPGLDRTGWVPRVFYDDVEAADELPRNTRMPDGVLVLEGGCSFEPNETRGTYGNASGIAPEIRLPKFGSGVADRMRGGALLRRHAGDTECVVGGRLRSDAPCLGVRGAQANRLEVVGTERPRTAPPVLLIRRSVRHARSQRLDHESSVDLPALSPARAL